MPDEPTSETESAPQDPDRRADPSSETTLPFLRSPHEKDASSSDEANGLDVDPQTVSTPIRAVPEETAGEKSVLNEAGDPGEELENQVTSISLASPASSGSFRDDSASPDAEAPPVSVTEPAEQSDAPALVQKVHATPSAAASRQRPGKFAFVLLVSYASAATLALLYLLLFGIGSQAHQLESLPDVKPEPAEQLTFVPVDASLPAGHVLSLGESRRFGNIVVEPLAVTEEPLNFTHYSGDAAKRREPAGPVLKLWIRFTNASADQSIAPLDRKLLLRWVVKKGTTQEYTNQYLFSPGAERLDDVVSVFRLPPASEWDLTDEQLGHVLEPGDSFETYVASAEDALERLQEEIRWRVQFRKGFSASGNGVTTVFDVAFHRREVTPSCKRCRSKSG